MTTATIQQFPPLESVSRPAVDTAAAAYYLNRRPQTLRCWAMNSGTGPVSCIRINGRLAWKVSDLRRVLGLAS
ncbi:DNA-binding protein [Hydrogenophaga sp.]|uniref:DNA-binding protein n=1 Tax=Hydrogenophaga sp. TaxID=1904254 RepID=UPI00262A9ACA|nr:DNA-binding protein [Hydrogenophaga sp.]MDM7950085.1 DNA-binding protein [Hydrogenophaga sp.]